jgi:DNA polymerase-3 subunit alpha
MDDFKILPLFKSHYSLGRSILTLEDEEEGQEGQEEMRPKSIIKICVEEGIKKLLLIEDSMSGFLQAYLNCEKHGVDLTFGLRVNVCQDISDKSEDSLLETSKIILVAKNKKGYEKLIKLYSIASTDGFYYKPRLDFNVVNEVFDSEHLRLCFPFYDSFIYKNLIHSSIALPDLSNKNPVFFIEDNDLPFDSLVKKAVQSYAENEGHSTLETKSIYYYKREDFKAYLTFRCIHNRSSLEKPRLDHMSSNEFCFESWKEKNGTNRKTKTR